MPLWPVVLRLKIVKTGYMDLITVGPLCSNLYLYFLQDTKEWEVCGKSLKSQGQRENIITGKVCLEWAQSVREEGLVILEIFVMCENNNICSVHLHRLEKTSQENNSQVIFILQMKKFIQ